MQKSIPFLVFLTALAHSVSCIAVPFQQTDTSYSTPLLKRQSCSNFHTTVTTYYDKGTDPNQITACGNTYNPNGMTAAITTQLAAANGGIEKWCGTTIRVSSADTIIDLTIEDSNATGGDWYGDDYVLDVTPVAFDQLAASLGGSGDNGPGQVTISWEVVPASYGDPCL